jgi:hypothetical protein
LFLGFASPLLHDKIFEDELLVNHSPLHNRVHRADVLHHFVYRQDIVPRALTLCEIAKRPLIEQLVQYIESIDQKIVTDLIGVALPDYHPCGHWHHLVSLV